MDTAMPETMKAAAIDRFGGPEVFRVRSLSVHPFASRLHRRNPREARRCTLSR